MALCVLCKLRERDGKHLCPECREEVTQQAGMIPAIIHIRSLMGGGLYDAQNLLADEGLHRPKPIPCPTTEGCLATLQGKQVLAIEALWDGDSHGWHLDLNAVCRNSDGNPVDVYLGIFKHVGGDFRLFRGALPPWPEATAATEVGTQLSERFQVPFYFPHPQEPDFAPSWLELNGAP